MSSLEVDEEHFSTSKMKSTVKYPVDEDGATPASQPESPTPNHSPEELVSSPQAFSANLKNGKVFEHGPSDYEPWPDYHEKALAYLDRKIDKLGDAFPASWEDALVEFRETRETQAASRIAEVGAFKDLWKYEDKPKSQASHGLS